MSLIQEALKRQQEESGKAGPKSRPAPPPLPPRRTDGPPPLSQAEGPTSATIQPPPVEETKGAGKEVGEKKEKKAGEEKNESRNWPTLVGILVLALLLAGGGVWMLVYAFQQWKSNKAAGPRIALLGKEQPTEPVQPDDYEPEVAQLDEPEPVEPEPMTEPGEEPTGALTAAVAEPGVGEEQIDMLEPLEWPQISLTAVVGKGLTGAAIINGQIVGVGEIVDDVEVAAVGRQGVKLQYMGESRFLKVGTTLE